MKLIYVAGKFRAPTNYQIQQNVNKAEVVALKLWKQGYVVICPHLNTRNFQGECPDDVYLEGCLEMLSRCDAIYIMKGWMESEGSKEEHALAMDMGLEIIYE